MWQYLTLCLLLMTVRSSVCVEKCKPNIAVIGGGIGGASASHFLGELFNKELHIDLYEAKTIGGRLATVIIDENEYEAGGSIIHHRNKYMQQFANLLGLEHRPSSHQTVGIWNGREFVFEESSWNWVTLAKLIYKYGIQPLKLNRHINAMLDQFDNIYHLQNKRISFENVTALLTAMSNEFPHLLEVTLKAQLLKLGYKEEFIDELVNSAIVTNYGQETNVQTFVGSVSLAAIGENLWAVKGGNKKVPEHLIYSNINVNVVPAYVKKIRNVPGENNTHSYKVYYTNKDSKDIMESTYDVVIIATQLTHDQEYPIEFEGFPKNHYYSEGKYHTTVATFIKGDLHSQYFGLDNEIDAILSCNPNNSVFNAIGRQISVEGPTEQKSRVWKIFSKEPLKAEKIQELFSDVEEIKEIPWKAYPQYSAEERFDKFKLYDNLYYVNAIEWAASAMEMSSIAGRNAAILAYNDFAKKCPHIRSVNANKEEQRKTKQGVKDL